MPQNFLTQVEFGHKQVEFVSIADGAISGLKFLLQRSDIKGKCLVVCDENTYAIFTKYVKPQLENYEILQLEKPKAELAIAQQIASKNFDFLLACGSGTINDLCKYASVLANKPYVSIATALSMNGYLSANASLITDNKKQSFAATQPIICVFDLAILTQSPMRLTNVGIGDSMCISTCESDWKLSHAIFSNGYKSVYFNEIWRYFEKIVAYPEHILSSNREAIEALAKTLTTAGLAMTDAGSSMPASQGEHILAHYMDSLYDDNEHYHGEHIAVTTMTASHMQDKVLTNILGNNLILNSNNKYPEKTWTHINNLLKDRVVIKNISSKKISTAQLEKIATTLGLPQKPEDLGWATHDYQNALKNAKYERDRFTFLDLI